jgi:hypothetical protein
MPMSHPSAPEMLAVIREYLEATILPELRDDKWFNVKVAANMLATIERELRLGPAANAEEIARLEAITGARGSLDELNRVLAARIRDGSIKGSDPGVLDHLRTATADALRINNPAWLTR